MSGLAMDTIFTLEAMDFISGSSDDLLTYTFFQYDIATGVQNVLGSSNSSVLAGIQLNYLSSSTATAVGIGVTVSDEYGAS